MRTKHDPRRGSIRSGMIPGLLGFFLIAGVATAGLQQWRATAARMRCTDHLHQIGMSAQAYSTANEQRLPHNQTTAPYGSWNAQLLPFLGEEKFAMDYQLSADWWDNANTTNRQTSQQRVTVFLCPAAPHPNRQVLTTDPDQPTQTFRAGATDYVGSAGAYLNSNAPENLHAGAMHHRGLQRRLRSGDILDGASHTFLVVEMADKPHPWRAGTMVARDREQPQMARFGGGQWAAPNWNHLRSHSTDGQKAFGPCAVNCSNAAGLYSFHPEGANVLFVDGSVKMIGPRLTQEVLVALVSYAGGEVLAPDDY